MSKYYSEIDPFFEELCQGYTEFEIAERFNCQSSLSRRKTMLKTDVISCNKLRKIAHLTVSIINHGNIVKPA
jgi:hypothetical protein